MQCVVFVIEFRHLLRRDQKRERVPRFIAIIISAARLNGGAIATVHNEGHRNILSVLIFLVGGDKIRRKCDQTRRVEGDQFGLECSTGRLQVVGRVKWRGVAGVVQMSYRGVCEPRGVRACSWNVGRDAMARLGTIRWLLQQQLLRTGLLSKRGVNEIVIRRAVRRVHGSGVGGEAVAVAIGMYRRMD